MWKEFKKLGSHKKNLPPTTIINHDGKLLKDVTEIVVEAERQEIVERLRRRPVRNEYNNLDRADNDIFRKAMTISRYNLVDNWNISELEEVIDKLDTKKCRDNDGISNSVYKPDTIGENLKQCILIMFNKMKNGRIIGSFLKRTNVKLINKKGSPLLLKNKCVIFLVSTVRNILIKLVYKRNYSTLDSNMTDNNMGARKNRRSNNNVLITQSIIHETVSSQSSKIISLQILDYCQMFDTVLLEKSHCRTIRSKCKHSYGYKK